jgi:hypothetical protein
MCIPLYDARDYWPLVRVYLISVVNFLVVLRDRVRGFAVKNGFNAPFIDPECIKMQ